MKAIRLHAFGGPEVLRLEEVPTPVAGAEQVLINVRAIGVNPIDTYLRSGSNPAIQLPWTPGLDAAGIVEEVGSAVSGWKKGDRVYTAGTLSGAYAEKTLCSAGQVRPLPGNLSFAQGAAINIPYATAWRALHQRAQARAGETVLIHGASGGVGIAAVQIARAAGLTVIGTAGTEPGRKLVHEQGAHHVLDHHSATYTQELLRFTGGRGVDVILEMLANVNLGLDLPLLALHGRVIVIGSRGRVELNPRDAMTREADIRGMLLFNVSGADLESIHVGLRVGFELGTLRPVIGHEIPLADAAKAHVSILEPGAYGKIVLMP